MKSSIIAKLLVILVALVAMVAIPLVGFTQQTYAATRNSFAFHPAATPTPEPAKWTEQSSILYATLPFRSYRLNIYTPSPAPQANTPVVIFFYGCCNPNTNRDNSLRLGKTPADPHEYLFRALINNGYQVVTLDFPSEFPIVDERGAEAGKAAVRFLRANAGTYHIDAARVIAWGSSAGGFPVTIMGTADAGAGLDIGQNLNFSSRVEAVIDWYGAASNYQYVTSDDAPFLIQQGQQDDPTLKADSQNLYNALVAVNVHAQLQYVANAGHKFAPTGGGTTNPTYEAIAQTAVGFLNNEVKNNPNPLPQ